MYSVPLKNVTAWDLKMPVPYKQYQQCFIQSYDNPYERVIDNKTEINLIVPADQILYGGAMVYYLGEVSQVKKLEN